MPLPEYVHVVLATNDGAVTLRVENAPLYRFSSVARQQLCNYNNPNSFGKTNPHGETATVYLPGCCNLAAVERVLLWMYQNRTCPFGSDSCAKKYLAPCSLTIHLTENIIENFYTYVTALVFGLHREIIERVGESLREHLARIGLVNLNVEELCKLDDAFECLEWPLERLMQDNVFRNVVEEFGALVRQRGHPGFDGGYGCWQLVLGTINTPTLRQGIVGAVETVRG